MAEFDMLRVYPFNMNAEEIIEKADKQFGKKKRSFIIMEGGVKVETLEEANQISYDDVALFEFPCNIVFSFDDYEEGSDLSDTIFWSFNGIEMEDYQRFSADVEQYLIDLYGEPTTIYNTNRYWEMEDVNVTFYGYDYHVFDWDFDGIDEGAVCIIYTDVAKQEERQRKTANEENDSSIQD